MRLLVLRFTSTLLRPEQLHPLTEQAVQMDLALIGIKAGEVAEHLECSPQGNRFCPKRNPRVLTDLTSALAVERLQSTAHA